MANPKHRHTKMRRDKRRAHDGLRLPSFSNCPQCHEPKLPHYVCLACGTYKGNEVIATKDS
ncbi:MAG: 50S ribosomal protein L32 [Nitrospiraceae bacterium]|nr:50S ribosomal protein L32 [Nitrospiraceae bacterium]